MPWAEGPAQGIYEEGFYMRRALVATSLRAGDVAVRIHGPGGLALLRLLSLFALLTLLRLLSLRVAAIGLVLPLALRRVLRRVLRWALPIGRPLRSWTGATPRPAVPAWPAPTVSPAPDHSESQEG